jgi:hypothetical protein
VLLKCVQIDWNRFWEMAREGKWERGCHLLLSLTEQFLGPQPITWIDRSRPEIPACILGKTALMMLQDTELRQDLAVQLELGTISRFSWPGAKRLLARLHAPRHIIAAHAGVSPNQPWIWHHYPSWLLSRLKRTLRGMLDQSQRAEVARATDIENWLRVYR